MTVKPNDLLGWQIVIKKNYKITVLPVTMIYVEIHTIDFSATRVFSCYLSKITHSTKIPGSNAVWVQKFNGAGINYEWQSGRRSRWKTEMYLVSNNTYYNITVPWKTSIYFGKY